MATLLIRGLKSRLLVTRGFGSTAPVTADHRTLYAQAATRSTTYLYVSAVGRKPSTEIDPSQTAATRK